MSELGDRLSQELDNLRTLRDELRVQIDLGKKEARQQWEKTENNFQELENKLRQIQKESQEPLHQVGEAARQLVHEIGEAYRTIKAKL